MSDEPHSDKYDQLVVYFPRNATHGTLHLVVEEREWEVLTACGKTLQKKEPQFPSSAGGYVRPLDENTQIGTNTCNQCLWDTTNE